MVANKAELVRFPAQFGVNPANAAAGMLCTSPVQKILQTSPEKADNCSADISAMLLAWISSTQSAVNPVIAEGEILLNCCRVKPLQARRNKFFNWSALRPRIDSAGMAAS